MYQKGGCAPINCRCSHLPMLGLSKIILSYWIAPDRTPAMGKGVAGMSSWGETGLEIEGCPAAGNSGCQVGKRFFQGRERPL